MSFTETIWHFNPMSPVPINYKGRQLTQSLKVGFARGRFIIVELKAVEAIHPVYSAQLLSYLKLAD